MWLTAWLRPVRSRIMRRARPYLLSLPALLVCIGILIPFGTAAYYSMMRFRLNLPMLKGFIWFDNYTALVGDATFWHTVSISLAYAGLTVGLELMLGLGIALCCRNRRDSQYRVHSAAAAADDGAGPCRAHVEADDERISASSAIS